MKKTINEVLGVPKNLTNTAKIIFNKIYDSIPDNITFDDIDDFTKQISGEFRIAELSFNEVIFTMNIDERRDLELIGMATERRRKLTAKFKLKTLRAPEFSLFFRFVGPKKTTGYDIKNLMKQKRGEFIGSIGHELKHYYDSFKKSEESLISTVNYQAASNTNFGDITPINRFIYLLYFSHVTESLVRPSELASLIDSEEITKKDFYDFITNTRTYGLLSELKNFNYNNFKNEVKLELPKIKKLFDYNNFNYDGLSDDEIVENAIKYAVLHILHSKKNIFVSLLQENPFEGLFGFGSEKQIFYDNFTSQLRKTGDNYENFYKREINNFNKVGQKMIRKIGKLYDLTK